MEVWKCGSVVVWLCGSVKVCKYANMQIAFTYLSRVYLNLAVWKCGGVEV